MSKINQISTLLEKLHIKYKIEENLSSYTSFKIGGKCPILCLPASKSELISTIDILKNNNQDYIVIGNGSNILFLDEGFDGAVIVLASNFTDITLLDNNIIEASAGTSLTRLCKFALDNELTGLENLFGIPATVGGAIYMNAGAYGSEIKDTLISATHIDDNSNEVSINASDLNLTYRHSFYSDKDLCIVSGKFKLQKGDKASIKAQMDDVMNRRIEKQPLEYPSAGSTFKRPEGSFAGKLIQDCELKGFCIGGAEVSQKHSGFVINKNNATSHDVLTLIEHVKKVVKENTGYTLECEVKIPKSKSSNK